MKLLGLALLVACSASSPQPIGTVNAVIGDTSFIRTFGRLPTPADDAKLRAATHVGYVAKLLRTRDAPSPELRAAREHLLDELDRYVAAGQFPDSETDVGLLPTFLDAHTGVRCAVADLVEFTDGTAVMTALDRDHHNDYIADIAADARFAAWADRSGFTRDELAMIQPAYPHRESTPEPEPPPDIEAGMSANYAHAAGHHDQSEFVRGIVRWIGHINNFGAQLDGGVGYVDSRSSLGFEAHLRGGMQAHLDGVMRFHYIGFTLGAGVDSYGETAAPAWTFPIDAYWRVRMYNNLVGVHGGPSFAAGDRAFGWNVGVDLVRLAMWGNDVVSYAPSDPNGWKGRDLLISLDATKLAGLVFVGVSVGFNARALGGFYGD
jgi:hypothetical protein